MSNDPKLRFYVVARWASPANPETSGYDMAYAEFDSLEAAERRVGEILDHYADYDPQVTVIRGEVVTVTAQALGFGLLRTDNFYD